MEDPQTHPDVEPAEPLPRRLADDPLSIFLVVGALLLGAMYLVERWHDHRLDQGALAVAELAGPVAATLDGCRIASAGHDGRSLVVACEGEVEPVVERLRQAWSDAALEGIEEVIFRAEAGVWACPPRPTQWLSGCRSLPNT